MVVGGGLSPREEFAGMVSGRISQPYKSRGLEGWWAGGLSNYRSEGLFLVARYANSAPGRSLALVIGCGAHQSPCNWRPVVR